MLTVTLLVGARTPHWTGHACVVTEVQTRMVWGDRLDASRCGRHHGRSTVSSPTLVREAVLASGVHDSEDTSRKRKIPGQTSEDRPR
jgi:hypothetical protein